MATEKRLIDANALKSCLCKCCNILYSEEPCEPSDCNVMAFIDEQPTVDAVEVVRCGECVHFCEPFCVRRDDETHREKINMLTVDFCSYGERKNNG